MRVFCIILFLGAALTSHQGLAHDGNNNYVTLQKYQLWSNTYSSSIVRVGPKDGVYNPAGCKNPDSYFLLQSLTDAAKKRIYSTLLSTVVTNRKVRAFIDSSKCHDDRPIIVHLIIEST